MKEAEQIINRGYILILNPDGTARDMPMVGVESVIKTFVEHYGSEAERALEQVEDFWSKAYHGCTVVIK